MCAVPSLPLVALFLYLPESPYLLVEKDQYKRARLLLSFDYTLDMIVLMIH